MRVSKGSKGDAFFSAGVKSIRTSGRAKVRVDNRRRREVMMAVKEVVKQSDALPIVADDALNSNAKELRQSFGSTKSGLSSAAHVGGSSQKYREPLSSRSTGTCSSASMAS